MSEAAVAARARASVERMVELESWMWVGREEGPRVGWREESSGEKGGGWFGRTKGPLEFESSECVEASARVVRRASKQSSLARTSGKKKREKRASRRLRKSSWPMFPRRTLLRSPLASWAGGKCTASPVRVCARARVVNEPCEAVWERGRPRVERAFDAVRWKRERGLSERVYKQCVIGSLSLVAFSLASSARQHASRASERERIGLVVLDYNGSEYKVKEYKVEYNSVCNLGCKWRPSSASTHFQLALLNCYNPAYNSLRVPVTMTGRSRSSTLSSTRSPVSHDHQPLHPAPTHSPFAAHPSHNPFDTHDEPVVKSYRSEHSLRTLRAPGGGEDSDDEREGGQRAVRDFDERAHADRANGLQGRRVGPQFVIDLAPTTGEGAITGGAASGGRPRATTFGGVELPPSPNPALQRTADDTSDEDKPTPRPGLNARTRSTSVSSVSSLRSLDPSLHLGGTTFAERRPLLYASLQAAAILVVSALGMYLVLKVTLPPIDDGDREKVKLPKSFDDLKELNEVLQVRAGGRARAEMPRSVSCEL